jgi:hypothetical protein
MGIRVSDDAREPPARRGAREMVRDVVKDQLIPVQRTDGGEQRIGNADQHIGDGLRDRLAPEIFLAMMQARGIKAQAPVELTPQIDELIEKLDQALQTTLAYAEESAPRPVGASLYDAVLTYAAMTERLFDVICTVTVTRTFRDPDRVQRELLYSLIREVIERAARDRGAREMTVELSRHRERHQLAIYHDGDTRRHGGRETPVERRTPAPLSLVTHGVGGNVRRGSAAGGLPLERELDDRRFQNFSRSMSGA